MPTKSKDLRKTAAEDLQGQLDEALKDLYTLRVRNVTKELSNTASIRQRRRDIARLRQAIGEKNQAGDAPAKTK